MAYQITTLFSADGTRLSKTYKLINGFVESDSYPHVRDFNSVVVNITNLEDLHECIVAVAESGGCLLKGTTNRQLIEESRQGATDPVTPTKYIVLDLDFEDGWDSIEEFLDSLGPDFVGISYVFQHSASAGIKCKPGMRGHVFIELDKPTNPGIIKEWLKFVNLTNPGLLERTTLSSTGHSLLWPVDISTCQNDKLIFVAPPTCEGFEPNAPEPRIRIVRRAKKLLLSKCFGNPSPAVVSELFNRRVESLRLASNLPKKQAKYKQVGSISYQTNPDNCVVTGVREARGFVYINLNGGDSWSRFFPANNPEYLYNFRDEPIVRLSDIARDFYNDYVAKMADQEADDVAEVMPLVFRDRKRDVYYNAVYQPQQNRIDFSVASNKSKLNDFMRQYGFNMPDIIYDWTVEFDPTRLDIVDIENRWLNTFHPTPILRGATAAIGNPMPLVIHKILLSVCGGCDSTLNSFVNWLASIFQTRKKTGTAWVFHGIEGTGKGLMLSKILKPIFGYDYVVEQTASTLEDSFNGQLEKAIILFIDEFQYDDTRSPASIMNKLKNLITEENIMLRLMRQNPVQIRSFCNVIIATNHQDPVSISINDRRFNISPPQEFKLQITEEEVANIETELQDFANFLAGYRVDDVAVRNTIKNEARINMIKASMTSLDSLFVALRTGDLEFFASFYYSGGALQDGFAFTEYRKIVHRMCTNAANDKPSVLDFGELRMIYAFVLGKPQSPAKLKRLLTIHRINVDQAKGEVIVSWKNSKQVAKKLLASQEEPTIKAVG